MKQLVSEQISCFRCSLSLLAMLDYSYWIINFSNKFVSKIINYNSNFDREREKGRVNFLGDWKFYTLKLPQTLVESGGPL